MPKSKGLFLIQKIKVDFYSLLEDDLIVENIPICDSGKCDCQRFVFLLW